MTLWHLVTIVSIRSADASRARIDPQLQTALSDGGYGRMATAECFSSNPVIRCPWKRATRVSSLEATETSERERTSRTSFLRTIFFSCASIKSMKSWNTLKTTSIPRPMNIPRASQQPFQACWEVFRTWEASSFHLSLAVGKPSFRKCACRCLQKCRTPLQHCNFHENMMIKSQIFFGCLSLGETQTLNVHNLKTKMKSTNTGWRGAPSPGDRLAPYPASPSETWTPKAGHRWIPTPWGTGVDAIGRTWEDHPKFFFMVVGSTWSNDVTMLGKHLDTVPDLTLARARSGLISMN